MLVILETEDKADVVIVAVGVYSPGAFHGVIAERDVTEQDGRISIQGLRGDRVSSIQHPVRSSLALLNGRIIDYLPRGEVLDLRRCLRRIQGKLRDRLADD